MNGKLGALNPPVPALQRLTSACRPTKIHADAHPPSRTTGFKGPRRRLRPPVPGFVRPPTRNTYRSSNFVSTFINSRRTRLPAANSTTSPPAARAAATAVPAKISQQRPPVPPTRHPPAPPHGSFKYNHVTHPATTAPACWPLAAIAVAAAAAQSSSLAGQEGNAPRRRPPCQISVVVVYPNPACHHPRRQVSGSSPLSPARNSKHRDHPSHGLGG